MLREHLAAWGWDLQEGKSACLLSPAACRPDAEADRPGRIGGVAANAEGIPLLGNAVEQEAAVFLGPWSLAGGAGQARLVQARTCVAIRLSIHPSGHDGSAVGFS